MSYFLSITLNDVIGMGIPGQMYLNPKRLFTSLTFNQYRCILCSKPANSAANGGFRKKRALDSQTTS